MNEEDYDYSKITYWVYAGEKWVDIDHTEFLKIEDICGGDSLTFIFEGVEYTSNIVRGSRPS